MLALPSASYDSLEQERNATIAKVKALEQEAETTKVQDKRFRVELEAAKEEARVILNKGLDSYASRGQLHILASGDLTKR